VRASVEVFGGSRSIVSSRALRNVVSAFSTFVQEVFCVRYAPTIISKRDCAGHQCWRPQAAMSVL